MNKQPVDIHEKQYNRNLLVLVFDHRLILYGIEWYAFVDCFTFYYERLQD